MITPHPARHLAWHRLHHLESLPFLAVFNGLWGEEQGALIIAAEPDRIEVSSSELLQGGFNRTRSPQPGEEAIAEGLQTGLTYGLFDYEAGIVHNWRRADAWPTSPSSSDTPTRPTRASVFSAFTRNIAVFSADGRLQCLAGPSAHFRQAIDAILESEPRFNQEPVLPTWRCGPFIGDWDASHYHAAFNRVAEYIRAGDCYQINLAQRFRAPFEGSSLAAFAALQARIGAPYAAYLTTPRSRIASLSPEHFITIDGQELRSDPIKGTRRRSSDPATDNALRQALRDSDKDRAENLMIVDLLRNDLGRVAVCGSVSVPDLFRVETFDNVHHLVSTIRATLRHGIQPLEALLGALPGGSITGAPKRRAVEIIAELEAAPRQAYCGTVFASYGRRLVSNITIRTLQFEGNTAILWGGGGIVADSQWASEYNESIIKINHIVSALGAPPLPLLTTVPELR